MPGLDLQRVVGRWRVPIPIIWLVAIDCALVVIYLIDLALGRPWFPFSNMVDLDAERNLPTWYASLKLFAVGFMMLLLANTFTRRLAPGAWVVTILGLALLGLSLDEFAGIHERIGLASDRFLPGGDRASTIFRHTGIWMFFLALPVLVAFLWLILRVHRRWDNPRATRIFVAGVTIFFGSAGGTEILSNFTLGFHRALQVAVEELGEMLGVSIMAWAAYELLLFHKVFCGPIVVPQRK